MIYPNQDSEKAISNYSIKLVWGIKKQKHDIDSITYSAGKPLTFLKQINKIKKYDIVHIQHEYNLLGWYGFPFFLILPYLYLIKKEKLIITMHTVLSKKEKLNGNILKKILRKFILYPTQNWLISKCCDKIIVHAEIFKNILKKEYNIKKEKIEVIRQGIIDNLNLPSKKQAKEDLGLRGPVYLIIGSMIPDHGSDIILKQGGKIGKTILVVANPKAVNDRNNKRVLNWIKYNKKIVKTKNIEKEVRFDIKNLPYSLWWKYFSAADLVLLPYRGGIGSGIYADAVATKTPMVCSNIKYFRESEKISRCLKVVKKIEDYPKKIKECMQKDTLKKMENECENYIKEYGLSKIGTKYKKIYETK